MAGDADQGAIAAGFVENRFGDVAADRHDRADGVDHDVDDEVAAQRRDEAIETLDDVIAVAVTVGDPEQRHRYAEVAGERRSRVCSRFGEVRPVDRDDDPRERSAAAVHAESSWGSGSRRRSGGSPAANAVESTVTVRR